MRAPSVLHRLAAGFASGFVINLGEWLLNGLLLQGDWDTLMSRLGLQPLDAGNIAVLTAMSFVMGFLLVALQNTLQSVGHSYRSTAVRAALFAWSFSYGLGFGWSVAMEIHPLGIYLPTVIWALAELLIGSFIGAKVMDALATRPADGD
ncbi:MAG: hypothetical protein H6741_19090 [Alphaproteobacteria bacterium]|nr:hypothetical protein [Alphaproteobacteria bacterium]MCB9794817.1 hypothetical protein [Alphaproteobacteria bacterium]